MRTPRVARSGGDRLLVSHDCQICAADAILVQRKNSVSDAVRGLADIVEASV